MIGRDHWLDRVALAAASADAAPPAHTGGARASGLLRATRRLTRRSGGERARARTQAGALAPTVDAAPGLTRADALRAAGAAAAGLSLAPLVRPPSAGAAGCDQRCEDAANRAIKEGRQHCHEQYADFSLGFPFILQARFVRAALIYQCDLDVKALVEPRLGDCLAICDFERRHRLTRKQERRKGRVSVPRLASPPKLAPPPPPPQGSCPGGTIDCGAGKCCYTGSYCCPGNCCIYKDCRCG
jgi:hypothetical protein